MSLSSAAASPARDDESTFTPDSSWSPDDTPSTGEKSKRKGTAGRKLQRWDPAKDQYVLLCIEKYVATSSVPFDWNEVAKLIAPTVTGEAIKQHLTKVRKQREDANQAVPPKITKENRPTRGSSLIAQTKTPRRSQATAKAQDPFFDKASDTKKDNLLFLGKTSADSPTAKVRSECGRFPASKKRKNAPDESAPTATKRRGKKQKVRESSFKTGLETDHLREQVEMGYLISTPKPTPAKTSTMKADNTYLRNMSAANESAPRPVDQPTNTRLRTLRTVNYGVADGTGDKDYEFIDPSPTLVPASQARTATAVMAPGSQTRTMHGLPLSAVTSPLVLTPDVRPTAAAVAGPSQQAFNGMDPSSGNMGSFNFNDILDADENFAPTAPAPSTQGHPTPIAVAGPSQHALVGMGDGITADGVYVYTNLNDIFPGFSTGLSNTALGDAGNALFQGQEELYSRASGSVNWLTNDSGTYSTLSRAQRPSKNDHTATEAAFDGANIGGNGMDKGIAVEGFNAAVFGKTDGVASRNDSFLDGIVDLKDMEDVFETAGNGGVIEGGVAAGAALQENFEDWEPIDFEEDPDFEGFNGFEGAVLD